MEADRSDAASPWIPFFIDKEKENESLRNENRWLRDSLADKISELGALEADIRLLADYLAGQVTGAPCPSGRAVEEAIRIINDLRSDLDLADALIRQYRQVPAIGAAEKDAEIRWLRSRVQLLTAALDDVGTSFDHHRIFIATLDSLIRRIGQGQAT